jgi:hypothetical protein
MRTTVDIDATALERARALAAREKRTLGSVVSDALAAYVNTRDEPPPAPPFVLLVRGKRGGYFPSAEEIVRAEEDDDLRTLGIPGKRDVAS